MAEKPEQLLLDANVLIDLQNSDFSVLKEVKKYVAEIYVLRDIFEAELPNLTEPDCYNVGLVVIKPEERVINESEINIGRLTIEDRLNLFTAIYSGLSLVTNDVELREVCVERNVKVIWGLQLLINLVEKSDYSINNAISIGTQIGESNVYITKKIIEKFIKKLDEIRKTRI